VGAVELTVRVRPLSQSPLSIAVTWPMSK
jgi:hypothetical protein